VSRSSLIQVPRDFSRRVKALMDAIVPAQSAAATRVLEPVLERARANWPVRAEGSQDSRGKLALTYTLRGGVFRAVLSNDAPYAYLINKGATAKGFIFIPGRKAAEKFGEVVAAEVARRAGRGR
jgi:hypothetical protein